MVICQEISQFWRWRFFFQFSFKSASKMFFLLGRRDPVLELQFLTPLHVVFFCNSASADRNVLAASRLLVTAAACVILLSFGAGHRKSYWSGCIKVAIVICQQIFSI